MAFKKSTIALSATNQFSKLIIDYISNDNSLRPFYSYLPTLETFQQVIEDKSKELIDRELLVGVLKNQYEKSNIQHPVSTIELLLKENTYTVCTGHQLCLFTGPLYFIYKIISTINLAEALKKKYPENNFVPVYWMASEDHDFEEIKSIHLFGKNIAWNNEEAKGAVGDLKTQSLDKVIDELKQILGESANANQLIQLFNNAYLKQSNLADATRYLVNELFEDYGLVILDANDKQLKTTFSEIIKDDILNNSNFKLVNKTIEELDRVGVKAQVNPREINCFYMMDGLRERIVFENSIYKIQNSEIVYTKVELLIELQNHPERFSPNVVLRPVYQQKILPNLAYVGGPGEIAYWLEYKAMFNFHKINFPVLMPRNFAMLMDEKLNQQLQKLGLTINDLFKDTELLTKEYVNKNASGEISLKEQEEKLTTIYNELALKVTAIDVTLKSSVEAELQKSLNALKNIETKLLRAEKQKQETSINQIKKIKDKFLPEGKLQERYDNIAPHYLKSGKQLIADLKEVFDPFEFQMLVLIN
jgi:bacillithiol biosynthesis cysteine-adding enzyme BshC